MNRQEAMQIYNQDKSEDIARMVARGEKDAKGTLIKPWVSLSYQELSELLTDAYLGEYVSTVQARATPPPKVSIEA